MFAGSFDVFMHNGGWVIFSTVAAAFSAGFYLVNQYLKQPGYILVFWMRVLVVIGMTPLMVQIALPSHPVFYLTVIATGLLGIGADVRTFNVSAKYGGGIVSRLMPITVWGSFLVWFAFHPALFFEYLARPWNTLGIAATLGGCVYFSMRLNKCEVTRPAFLEMLPSLIAYVLTTVLNKVAMQYGVTGHSFSGAVFAYMYVQSVVGILMLGAYSFAKPERASFLQHGKPLAIASVLAGLVWFCHMIYKNYGMAYTPNPSYLAAISLTAPVFIAAFYYCIGHKETADVKSGMGIVICAILLALLAI